MTISKGTSGRVAPRLSLALKHQIRVRVGDCIAQIIFEKIEFLEVAEVDKLTERSEKGFGSTGRLFF